MRELQEKQRTKRRLYSIPVLIILAIVVIFLIRGTYAVIQKDLASSDSLKELQSKEAVLADRETQLKSDISRLNTDSGIDAEIKDKFSVSKPGEHVVVIVDEKVASTSSDASTTPWYKKLWAAILGL